MADHNELGTAGEDRAANWLEQHGYTVLHRNWRHTWHEIDIVATRGRFLHFVEVKTRWSTTLGNPEDSVTKKKFRNLKRAADEYLFRHPGYRWIQYDILSITYYRGRDPVFFLLEDVFI